MDDARDVCFELFQEARRRVEEFEDATDIFRVLSRIEMITILCTNIRCGASIEKTEIEAMKAATVKVWMRECESEGRENVEEWQSDIEAVFDRLLDWVRKSMRSDRDA